MGPIYKLLSEAEWRAAEDAGVFTGSAVDRADGFIHFSSAEQLEETARRHFHGRAGLVCLEVAAEALGAALVWEPSRGGALFPHLYGPLSVDAVTESWPVPLDGDGNPLVAPPRP